MSQPSSFIERLVNHLSLSAHSKTVFADPVAHRQVKIVPVAKCSYSFGGGYERQKAGHTGKGAGGHVKAQPVGYIEMKEDTAVFKPIKPPASPWVILGGVALGLFVIKRILRRSK